MDLRRWVIELRGGKEDPRAGLMSLLDLVTPAMIHERIGEERTRALLAHLRAEARTHQEAAIGLLRFGGQKFEDVTLLNEAKAIADEMEQAEGGGA